MPVIQVDMLDGKTEEQKDKLIGEITNAVCRSVNVSPETVTVIIRDTKPINWGNGGKSKKQK